MLLFLLKLLFYILNYFLEVVRTRLREENSKAKGFFVTLSQLWRKGGIRLLYRGLFIQVILYFKL